MTFPVVQNKIDIVSRFANVVVLLNVFNFLKFGVLIAG